MPAADYRFILALDLFSVIRGRSGAFEFAGAQFHFSCTCRTLGQRWKSRHRPNHGVLLISWTLYSESAIVAVCGKLNFPIKSPTGTSGFPRGTELSPTWRSIGLHPLSVGPQLAMPHSRVLGAGLRELRLSCEGTARRITYYFDIERKVITLTTFRKQRNSERSEIDRAQKAKRGDQRAKGTR